MDSISAFGDLKKSKISNPPAGIPIFQEEELLKELESHLESKNNENIEAELKEHLLIKRLMKNSIISDEYL